MDDALLLGGEVAGHEDFRDGETVVPGFGRLLAGEEQKAEAAIEKAIKRFPGDPDMLIDRARIRSSV